ETGRARTGAAVGAPAGAADAIAAWLLGWALRLPAGADGYDWSWLPVAVAAGAVFGTLEGAVGGWIGARRSRTRARTA
ncbi:MAG TPA: hypothetical protein VM290_08190, partial [Gaiellaceae bacterium]|nr:hypothetical protein [Gaiellaceae bacterium]